MQRRTFLKTCSLCAFSGLMLSACTNDDNKENIVSDKYSDENLSKYFKDGEKYIKQIEILVCYHCNLNCACCSSYAPLAPYYEMPVDVFKNDLKRLAKITKSKVENIELIGGEPTLHKDLNELMVIARNYFPFTNITILTNGLLLNEMKEDFWKTCGKCGVNVRYSKYPKYEKYPKDFEIAEDYAKKYNVSLALYKIQNTFMKIQISTKPIYDGSEAYVRCLAENHNNYAPYAMLDNGKLYTCTAQGNLRFLNAYFKDKQIPVHKEDILDLYKINNIDDILDFFKTPKNCCKHCGVFIDRVDVPWHPTERKASEWFQDA